MLKSILGFILKSIGWFGSKISWYSLRAIFNDGQFYDLTRRDLDEIRKRLTDGYYIILVKNTNTLSSWLICAAGWFVSGHWGHYTHVMVNIENKVVTDEDFRIVEASANRKNGAGFVPFWNAFAVDSVALLRPRGLTVTEWNKIFEKLLKYEGQKYDSAFDLSNDKTISCVELVRLALQTLPDYETRFSAFEEMVTKNKNLTPQDYYDCSDFDHVWEVRR